ncbi:MAG TPA: sigma-54 dependent transcriptional regulator [Terriglobales bacterium]|nr:sigma-54 dependent transcriptional regulator [Terriglobales bacterium]
MAAVPISTSAGPAAHPLLGDSPSIVSVRQTIAQVAGTNLTVLLQGESGTGKEVAARMLALHSGRAPASFIKINCAAVPHELWESELFGYEPGAFTGANHHKSGKFELAGGGTMFLDEISEMPLSLQAKLLQVLQDGEFSRLGSQRSLSVDVRVIAATNVDLHAAVAAGQFRRDLFFRLNVIAIQLPPLRQRLQDLPLLAAYFLDKYASVYQRSVPPFSPALERRLLAYSWPGNVRELENLIKRYVILGDEDAIFSDLVRERAEAPAAAAAPAPDPVSRLPLLEVGRRAARAAEREELLRVLNATRWNRRQAALQLQISYKSLQNKLKLLLDGPGPRLP